MIGKHEEVLNSRQRNTHLHIEPAELVDVRKVADMLKGSQKPCFLIRYRKQIPAEGKFFPSEE